MEYIDLGVKIIGVISILFGIYQFKKKRELQALEMFIKYREKLKTNESINKIVRHVQDCESDSTLQNQIIERDITKYDFYYFLGYYEEIAILYKSKLLNKQIANDMFAYYALKIASNEYYWKTFNEDYKNERDWKNFNFFIDEMTKIRCSEEHKKRTRA
jgi:hypothetical protein